MGTLQELLNREMDRREFLLYLGILLLAVTGISGLIKNLTNPYLVQNKVNQQAQGFGSGSYGGTPRKGNS